MKVTRRAKRRANTSAFASIAAAAVLTIAAPGAANAAATTESGAQTYVDNAAQYLAKGNLKAAEIELRNAARQAPQNASVHLRLAELYLRMGNFPDAESEARTARARGADEAGYLPLLIDAMLRQGKSDRLLDEVHPGNRAPALESKVLQGLAAAYLHSQQYDKALADLRDAVRLAPDATSAKLALARVLLLTRKPDNVKEAEAIVDKLITADPHAIDALQMKAGILGARGDRAGAMQRLNEVLATAPNDTAAHLARANLYLLQRDWANTDKDLDPILKAAPNNVMANYLKASELAQKNDFKGANQILQKISAAFPQLVEGYYLAGAVDYKLGQLPLAADNIDKYLGHVPGNPKASRLAALIAMAQKAPDRAETYLKNALSGDPKDVATITMLGNAYLADHKPALALEQFEAAAALAPDNPQIQTRMAVSSIDAGQGEQGLSQLEKVFDNEKNGKSTAGPVLILTQLRTGRLVKASAEADALVKQDPNNSLYQTLQGLVRVAQHDYAGAEAAFQAVVARDPKFLPATRNLAQVYLAAGKRDQAEKAYQTLLQQQPNDVAVLLTLTDFALARKDWQQASDYIDRAQKAAPDDAKPGLKRVQLSLMQKDVAKAKSTVDDLAAHFSSDPAVIDAQVAVALADKNTAGALAIYKRTYATAPNSTAILGHYLTLLAQTKDYQGARSVLQQALQNAPDNRALKLDLVRVTAQIDGTDAGIAKATEFAAKDTDQAPYDLVSAELYQKAGKIPEAIALLEKIGNPPTAPVAVALSRLYMQQKEPEKAETLLKASLGKTPDDQSLQQALGDFYLSRNQLDPALAQYDTILKQNETNAIVLNNAAWIYQQKGDLTKARALAERAAAIAPKASSVADTLGWIMVAQGDAKSALPYLKTASAESASKDPNIQYHLAVALRGTGQVADAKALLETLLTSGASFQSKADAEKLLEELKKS